MGWTLDDVRDLPQHYYEFLCEEINAHADKARR